MSTETKALAVSNPITERHMEISQLFIEKVISMIGRSPEVQKYSVDQMSYANTEAIELRIDDRTSIRICLTESK